MNGSEDQISAGGTLKTNMITENGIEEDYYTARKRIHNKIQHLFS